jgi:predicted MPP superfamily phosphohydrolase
MVKPDFTRRRHFPGTVGNPFDVVLQAAEVIQNLPAPIFAALLLVIALTPVTLGVSVSFALALWIFFLSDWALLDALPRRRISFGPAKPPTLVLAVLRLLPALLPWPIALAAQLIGTALVVYGFWIEPQRLGLTRQTLHSPKLNPQAKPLRALHLGDLHMERRTPREQKLIEMIRDAQPDVILFSGDFLNLSNLHDPLAWDECRAVLRELSAPLGAFAVTGSPAVDLDAVVPELLKEMPNIRWLKDERVTLTHDGQAYDLIGLACSHKPFEDAPKLLAALGSNFSILLYHSPDLAPDAAEAGVDLQLSGHTHGGQVRLPLFGAFFAGSLYGKRFEMGRKQVEGLTLYVMRGIGMEGKGAPRVRFLCPPEIVLWEIGG